MKISTVMAALMKGHAERIEYASKHMHLVQSVLDSIDGGILSIDLYSQSIDISITGDYAKFKEVWRALRLANFKLEYEQDRPKGKFSFWRVSFGHDSGARICLNFSSSVCQRVQVGTEMMEVPIYDVVCREETPDFTDLAP